MDLDINVSIYWWWIFNPFRSKFRHSQFCVLKMFFCNTTLFRLICKEMCASVLSRTCKLVAFWWNSLGGSNSRPAFLRLKWDKENVDVWLLQYNIFDVKSLGQSALRCLDLPFNVLFHPKSVFATFLLNPSKPCRLLSKATKTFLCVIGNFWCLTWNRISSCSYCPQQVSLTGSHSCSQRGEETPALTSSTVSIVEMTVYRESGLTRKGVLCVLGIEKRLVTLKPRLLCCCCFHFLCYNIEKLNWKNIYL